jgi:hypothetical protein
VLHFCGDEEHASSRNVPVLVGRSETRSTAEHVIHLIFMMRALWVRSSGGQHIKSRAHGGYTQKLPVPLAARSALLLEFLRIEKGGFWLSHRFSLGEL